MTDSQKLDLLLTKVGNIETDVAEVKADVAELKADMVEVKADVAELKMDVSVLKGDVAGIRLVIDNELRVNIKRVAEGHLDLVRHLKEAGKKDSEMEMLTVRVNVLERDVRELQHRFA